MHGVSCLVERRQYSNNHLKRRLRQAVWIIAILDDLLLPTIVFIIGQFIVSIVVVLRRVTSV